MKHFLMLILLILVLVMPVSAQELTAPTIPDKPRQAYHA